MRFNVLRPTIAAGDINSQFIPDPVRFRNVPPLDWVLSLGIETGTGASVSGINFNARVSVPEGGDGELAYVQLVKGRHAFSRDLLTYIDLINTNGEYALDAPVPYNEATFGVTPQADAFAATGDRPQIRGLLDEDARATVDDDFRMFLMYRPDGTDSIWVTLREIEWGWTAIVSHPVGTPWTENAFESTPVLRGRCPPIPATCDSAPAIIDTSVFPTWTRKAIQ